ncbi:MarR family winged helix-turn-helix transcriptional regulator [Sulfuracidifex metallicus]|uniref:MarR family winged helix-turn-helix transcriptional regulator n=1 Tax=Sulfuracidifex metallicus TaxID=47303 RepID=UPI002274E9BF|nr:MarR family winged helix-turn-helix transcriptional regulator [Sulfuracidifex metallicus]MCY0850382.1 MarR family winged helix-turn-helix transcriptional regulator [Sulfuracidifex metallicus]
MAEKIKEMIEFLSQPIFSSPIKIGILIALMGVNEMSFTELQNDLGINKSTLSSVLENLEKEGLIKSFIVVENRPKKHVKITEKGREIITTYLDYMEKYTSIIKGKK